MNGGTLESKSCLDTKHFITKTDRLDFESFVNPACIISWLFFRQFISSGVEQGGMFAVYNSEGQPLIEIWGGYADIESHRPWREDTLTMVWSCTKGAAALAVAKLVDM